MKIAVLLLVVLAAVAVRARPEGDANVETALQKCASTRGLKKDLLNMACEGTLPTDEKQLHDYKCFAMCVQQQVGIMSEDGTVNPARSASLVAESQKKIMTEIAEACQGGQEKDLCQKAFNVDSCYSEKNNTMYQANCKGLIKLVT